MNMNDVKEVIKLLDGYYAVKTMTRSRMYPEPGPLPTEIHNVKRPHLSGCRQHSNFSASFDDSDLRKS